MKALAPLQCGQCGSPVPLGPGESVPCPACSQAVELPVEYRGLRDSEAKAARVRVEAQRLYAALGTRPAAFWRLFVFVDSSLFWAFGLPLWLCVGTSLSFLGQAAVGRALHANAADVLEPRVQVLLAILFPLGTTVLGLLFSGWARQRTVSLAGLQLALAAAAPARDGGPSGCRHCGAPLSVSATDLGVRCPFCGADNLVKVPAAWLAKRGAHTAKVGAETDAAVRAFAASRRRLRQSFRGRLVVGTLVLSPVLLLAGMSERLPGVDAFDVAANEPRTLPSWREVSKIPPVACRPENLALFRHRTEAKHCAAAGCEVFRLLALTAGQRVVVVSGDAPEGSEAWLEAHVQGFLSDRWEPVTRLPLTAGLEATGEVTRSGWYRLRARLADPTPGRLWSLCVSRD